MRKLTVFNQVSLDGYIADDNGDMSWAHKSDPEWNAFTSGNASGGGELVFGRITYDLMASFWPTPMATQSMPVVAERMNNLPKVVFSRSMKTASWKNTKVVGGDIVAEMRRMKNAPGPDIVILGSGSIVSQFAKAGLIDSYMLVINPLVIGGGTSMFSGAGKMPLELVNTRRFGNGNVVLLYTAGKAGTTSARS